MQVGLPSTPVGHLSTVRLVSQAQLQGGAENGSLGASRHRSPMERGAFVLLDGQQGARGGLCMGGHCRDGEVVSLWVYASRRPSPELLQAVRETSGKASQEAPRPRRVAPLGRIQSP